MSSSFMHRHDVLSFSLLSILSRPVSFEIEGAVNSGCAFLSMICLYGRLIYLITIHYDQDPESLTHP